MSRGMLLTAGVAVGLAAATMADTFAEEGGAIRPPAPHVVPTGTFDPTRSFAPLVESLDPAVVAIEVEAQAVEPEMPVEFRRFFGQGGPRHGEGSGFVISADGLVLTNAHVVNGADRITAVFHDGTKVKAKVLGKDSAMDVALLRLEEDRAWTHLELGSSDALRVGDWVLAMGNPLGLGNTVTAGIVSGKGRVLGHDVFGNESFIQTDAAINQGNSGGPLFDLHGRVVGINTAIIAGANTVGFAIPIDLVEEVLDDLRHKGKVARGYLGVRPQALDDPLAAALGLDEAKGALVSQVYPGTPAQMAGLQRGDVIVRVDGDEIAEPQDLIARVGNRRPGEAVDVAVLREGKTKSLKLVLGERPGDDEPVPTSPPDTDAVSKLGLGLRPMPESMVQELGTEGVWVERVVRGSPAAGRLRAGDVILEVNRRRVRTPDDVEALLSRATGNVSMLIVRGDAQMFVPLSLE